MRYVVWLSLANLRHVNLSSLRLEAAGARTNDRRNAWPHAGHRVLIKAWDTAHGDTGNPNEACRAS